MHVPISEAKTHLTDLARRAEAGEEVVLTRHGRPSVRLVPVVEAKPVESRRAIIERISKQAAAKALPGPCAARSQDFLYDEFGIPA